MLKANRKNRSRRSQRRRPLQAESLEPRWLLSVSAQEQYFIYRINYARHDPEGYAAEVNLGVSLAGVEARQPLAINDALISSSNAKTDDMVNNNYFGHTSPSGLQANKLVRDHSYNLPATLPVGGLNYIFNDNGNSVESLAAGYSTVDVALEALIEDVGINPPGHRYHLLGVVDPYSAYREIGIGYTYNSSTTYRHYWAMHIAAQNTTQSYLTGVVYNDGNGNTLYDQGEGLGGVTISAGGVNTTTNSQGGWSLAISDGAHQVTASGGAFSGSAQVTATVSGQNVEVDFISGNSGGFVDFVPQLNSAPVLDPSGSPALADVFQNESDPSGNSVSSLIAGAVSDADAGALEGIALVGASNASGGIWQYSLNGGANWSDTPSVAPNSALLLRDSDLLRFVPSGVGGETISYHAWDQTSDAAGDLVDLTSGTGGATAFSLASETASITIQPPPNIAPSANADELAATVDGARQINVLDNDTDPDGDSLSLVSFTQGTNGSVTDQGNGLLLYTPVASFTGSDSFDYTISDGRGGADTATVSVTVTPPLPGLVGRRGDTWWVAQSTGSAFVNQTWGQWTADSPLQDARVADVTGDGLDDIVGRHGDQLWVGRSTGQQFVQEQWGQFASPGPWTDFLVADVNGDDRYDVVARENGVWWVARSTGSAFVVEQWGSWSTGPLWQDVLVADVNNDGLDDIVGRASGNWWVAVSNGSGFGNERWGSWSNAQWRDVMIADVNADGRDDIVGRRSGSWWVAVSDGSQFTNQSWGSWSASEVWLDVRIADVNGDNRDDIVGRANGGWWVAQSDGAQFSNSKWVTWSETAAWLDVQIADVNGDGRDDIVAHSNGKLYVARSTGAAFVTEQWGNWAEVPWFDVMMGRYTGNSGQPRQASRTLPLGDVAGRANGSWWVAHSTGSEFTNVAYSNWSANAAWTDVQAGDVNNDGLTDIVGRSDGKWYVARSIGSDFVTTLWARWSVNVTWTDVLVGDFNGDHSQDIVGRARNKWWVGLSSGSGFLNQKWGNLSDNISFEEVFAADVDGDGADDIVGRRATGELRVMRSTGSQFLMEVWGQWSSGNWVDVNAADLNGDGRDDLVGRLNGDWWVATSSGSQFASATWGQWSTSETWLEVQVADVDGDHRHDIVGRAGGDWWVARSTGSALNNELWVQWLDVAWQDALLVDLNADQRADLVGRLNGDWSVSLSTGSSFASPSVWGSWSAAATWVDVLAGDFHHF